MRKILALVRANWLSAVSYRLDVFFSFVALPVGVVPLYLVSRALQPTMAESIQGEAQDYFGFLMLGLLAYGFAAFAVSALHSAIGREISTGSLEALLATPTPLPILLIGTVGQAFSMLALRSTLVFLFAVALGAHVVWSGTLTGFFILVLIILSYLPFGLMAAALTLAFRTTGPFPGAILSVTGLLGGVYYPATVVPSWIEGISMFVPLTYSLRSLRRSVLEGASISSSASDLALLTGATIVLMAVGLGAFSWALRHAKRAGTLAQY